MSKDRHPDIGLLNDIEHLKDFITEPIDYGDYFSVFNDIDDEKENSKGKIYINNLKGIIKDLKNGYNPKGINRTKAIVQVKATYPAESPGCITSNLALKDTNYIKKDNQPKNNNKNTILQRQKSISKLE